MQLRPWSGCLLFAGLSLAVLLTDYVNKPLATLVTLYRQDLEQRHRNGNFIPRAAQNVILLLIEGLDSHTMSVARQLMEARSDTTNNHMAALDYFLSGHLKPSSRDFIVADPAAAVSAIFNGVPEFNGQMGWVEQELASCQQYDRSKKLMKNLFKLMSESGKQTALLTTSRLTSPGLAATYAASPDMQIESDVHLQESGCNDGKFKDIATQLIQDYKDINVIVGRGRQYFIKDGNRNLSSNTTWFPWRSDIDLKTYWSMEKTFRKTTHKDALGTQAIKDSLVTEDNLDYFLGFLDEEPGISSYDDLQDIISLLITSLNVRSTRQGQGYFMTIYDDQLARDHETDALNVGRDLNSILKLINYLDTVLARADDTLIVVSSVQGSTLTLGSGRLHEETILGTSFTSTCSFESSKVDYSCNSRSRDNSTIKTAGPEFTGGPDLPVFSRGPGAHAFTGINDFAYLYHALAYAACLTPDSSSPTWDHCAGALTQVQPQTTNRPVDTNSTRLTAPPNRPSTYRPIIWPWVPQPLPQPSLNPYSSLGFPYFFNGGASPQNAYPNQNVVKGVSDNTNPVRNPSPNIVMNQLPTRHSNLTSLPNPAATRIPPGSTIVRTVGNVPQTVNQNPNSDPSQQYQNPWNWASFFPFFF